MPTRPPGEGSQQDGNSRQTAAGKIKMNKKGVRLEADVAKGKAEAAKGGVFGRIARPRRRSEKGYNCAAMRQPVRERESRLASRVHKKSYRYTLCARTLVRLSPALLGIIATAF